jgi:hypothetical protein
MPAALPGQIVPQGCRLLRIVEDEQPAGIASSLVRTAAISFACSGVAGSRPRNSAMPA